MSRGDDADAPDLLLARRLSRLMFRLLGATHSLDPAQVVGTVDRRREHEQPTARDRDYSSTVSSVRRYLRTLPAMSTASRS